MPHLSRDNDVFILDLGEQGQVDTENRMTLAWFDEVSSYLDEVEASTGPAALVTTGTGKFYSNGYVPEQLLRTPEDKRTHFLVAQALFARLLSSELPTIAALNGHAFAAGALLAIAHDERVMRADRGFFCLPEIDLGIPIPPGMVAMLLAQLPARTAQEAMFVGKRYGAVDALAEGIVSGTAPAEELLAFAVDRAAQRAGKRGQTLAAIKSTTYRQVLTALQSV